MGLAKITGLIMTLLIANTTLSADQANKRRKRNSAKYPRTEISCSHDLNDGTLCGPPVILRADTKDGVSLNTVTVQISIDEEGKVIAAKAVSGDPQLYKIAVENAKARRFAP